MREKFETYYSTNAKSKNHYIRTTQKEKNVIIYIRQFDKNTNNKTANIYSCNKNKGGINHVRTFKMA